EPRMADDGLDRRSASQIHDAPEGAEQSGRNRRIAALQLEVPGAERDARDEHTEGTAAEPDIEAVQQERALNLLAHAARDRHDDGEERRLARRSDQLLKRVSLDRVERRRKALYQ